VTTEDQQGFRVGRAARRTADAVSIPPFARILLERGVPVADVADLLGDDEKTVREPARWVPERQARLTKILKAAFDGCAQDSPRFAVGL